MNALDQDSRLLNHYTIQTNPGTFKAHNEKTVEIATHNEFAAFVHHGINVAQLQAQGLDHSITTNSSY